MLIHKKSESADLQKRSMLGPKKNSNWLKTAWRFLGAPTYCVFANPHSRFFCVATFYDYELNNKRSTKKYKKK